MPERAFKEGELVVCVYKSGDFWRWAILESRRGRWSVYQDGPPNVTRRMAIELAKRVGVFNGVPLLESAAPHEPVPTKDQLTMEILSQ